MSQSTSSTPPASPSASPPRPMLHLSNVLGSPGATWAGVAAIAGVLAAAMHSGMPTSPPEWAAFIAALATGLGGVFGR